MELNYNCVNDIIRYLRDNLRPHAQIELDEIIQSLKKYSYDDYLTCSRYLKQCGYVDAVVDTGCFVDNSREWDTVIFKGITPQGYAYLESLSDNETINAVNRSANNIANSGVVNLVAKVKGIHK